jgi:hypothetical protein
MKTLRKQAIAHQKEVATHHQLANTALHMVTLDRAAAWNHGMYLDTACHHQWMARHHAECAWRCLLALLLREPII